MVILRNCSNSYGPDLVRCENRIRNWEKSNKPFPFIFTEIKKIKNVIFICM